MKISQPMVDALNRVCIASPEWFSSGRHGVRSNTLFALERQGLVECRYAYPSWQRLEAKATLEGLRVATMLNSA